MIWHFAIFVAAFWLLALTYFCGALGVYWHGLLDYYRQTDKKMRRDSRATLRHRAFAWPALTMHTAAKYWARRKINLAKADHEEMMVDYTCWRAAAEIETINEVMGIPTWKEPEGNAWHQVRRAVHDPATKELLGYVGWNEKRREWDIIDYDKYRPVAHPTKKKAPAIPTEVRKKW